MAQLRGQALLWLLGGLGSRLGEALDRDVADVRKVAVRTGLASHDEPTHYRAYAPSPWLRKARERLAA